MLLGQNFSRRHECDLISIFDGNYCGLESDQSFAGPYVALQQTAHGIRLCQIASDFFECAFLRAGRMEGQDSFDRLANTVIQIKPNSGLRLLLAALKLEAKLDKK